ncbi:MAG: DUF4406 domain-containing protein [Planctomycetota bacterium]
MKLVYVGGPYRALTEFGVHRNIQAAELWTVELLRLGAAVICPHKNTAYLGGAVSDKHVLAADLEILRRCDAMFLIPGWWHSAGTLGEIAFATEMGIPVFERLEELAAWLDANVEHVAA